MLCKDFKKDESAVAMVIFAIALPVIMLILAVAIDLSKTQGEHQDTVNATDAAVATVSDLILKNAQKNLEAPLVAGEAPTYFSKSELAAAGLESLKANLKNLSGSSELVPSSFALSLAGDKVTVSACVLVKPNTLAAASGLAKEQQVCSNSVAPIVCPAGGTWNGNNCEICPSEFIITDEGRKYYIVGNALSKINLIKANLKGIHSTPGWRAGPNGGRAGNRPRGTSMHGQAQIDSYISITDVIEFNYYSSQTRGWQTYRGVEFLDINNKENTKGIRFNVSATNVPDYALDENGKCVCQNRYFYAKGKQIFVKANSNIDEIKAQKDVFHFNSGHTAGPNGGYAGNGPRGTSMFSPAQINEFKTVTSLQKYGYGTRETRGWQNYRGVEYLGANNLSKTSGLRFKVSRGAPVCALPFED